MVNQRILIIGDTSSDEALGAKLLRGAKEIGLNNEWIINCMYTSPSIVYSPSMRKLYGKIIYRLADKRSWEWRAFQRKLEDYVATYKPKLIIVTGILPLRSRIFTLAKRIGCKICNYLTDDPWNPIHKRKSFISNLCLYDYIFSTKEGLANRLRKASGPEISWLPFAYDPHLHYPVEREHGPDIIFVGTGAKERLKWLIDLSQEPQLERHIYGNNWEGIKIDGWEKYKAITGHQYCSKIMNAKVVLGLLREANGDLSTDRSYEIGAIGGCGLYKETSEHRSLLIGYPDVGFFANQVELVKNARLIISNDLLQEELRRAGSRSIRRYENTYAARLNTIIERCGL